MIHVVARPLQVNYDEDSGSFSSVDMQIRDWNNTVRLSSILSPGEVISPQSVLVAVLLQLPAGSDVPLSTVVVVFACFSSFCVLKASENRFKKYIVDLAKEPKTPFGIAVTPDRPRFKNNKPSNTRTNKKRAVDAAPAIHQRTQVVHGYLYPAVSGLSS